MTKKNKLIAKINCFNFDISKEKDFNEWEQLKEDLKNKFDYKLFDCYNNGNDSDFLNKLKQFPELEIDTNYIFNDQLNTVAPEGFDNGFRLHFFYQPISLT